MHELMPYWINNEVCVGVDEIDPVAISGSDQITMDQSRLPNKTSW